ncbi:CRISPR-associated protein Cse1, partial [mine drainage metagenome]
MNLINDAWIPARRADGTTEKIEPWRLTDHIGTGKSPIIAVASPRPDFDGALTQFLIGLLQTTCTPETESAWWDWRESPPSSSTLRKRFASIQRCS